MKPVEDQVGRKPRTIALRRTKLGRRVYLQLEKTLLGDGFVFRAQLVDFFPDPYDETFD